MQKYEEVASMNSGIRPKDKSTELQNSLGWLYKDLLKFIVGPTLGMVLVLAALSIFKDQFYIIFNMDNYLIWHNISEFSSVVASFGIFLLSWYAYGQSGNRRELFVGVAFLIVGAVDFMHALSFPGMPDFFSQNSTSKAIDYWIIARLVQATALALSGFIPTRYEKQPYTRAALTIGAVLFISITFYVVIYMPEKIPVMFLPGKGLTPTKVWLEYTVILLTIVAIGKYANIYWHTRDPELRILMMGLTYFVFSELAFTLYASAFDSYNLLGHIFKFGATASIFMALFVSSVEEPFTERKRAEEDLKEYSGRLEVMVEERTQKLRDAQETLVQKERLAVLGQLAGGVGHELRNPLGVISNAVYYLQAINPDADESTREYLNMISSEVRDAEKIISDLLDFSRTRMPERQEIGVSELVAQVLEKKPPPENVGVKTEFPEDLPEVYVDPAQINQVLINLVVNAYQAMNEGGKLVIKGENKNNQVLITINDNGSGISEDHMTKLFEPLFTTKAKGIGLGLAVSKNLVETNGGTIEVESEEGAGSTFTLHLPIYRST